MRKLALLFALLASCMGTGLSYDNNDLELVTAYRAKEMCSCLFVMGQTEDYCAEWTVADPNVAKFTIDRAKKRVTTTAIIMWNASAHWESERFGCVLD